MSFIDKHGKIVVSMSACYECPTCCADVNHENNFCYKCGQRLE